MLRQYIDMVPNARAEIEETLRKMHGMEHNYGDDIKSLLKMAYFHLILGQYEEAINVAKKVLAGEPANFTAWQILGDAYFAREMYLSAFIAYNKATLDWSF